MYHLHILRTVNLKGRQNGRQFVPVDTKTVSLKLLVLLVMICDWCLWQVNWLGAGTTYQNILNVTHWFISINLNLAYVGRQYGRQFNVLVSVHKKRCVLFQQTCSKGYTVTLQAWQDSDIDRAHHDHFHFDNGYGRKCFWGWLLEEKCECRTLVANSELSFDPHLLL